jgi:sugar/nucleoside kinase (ribokinase family)
MAMLPLFTFGDLVLDVVARVDGLMAADTDTPGDVASSPGGSAANFAVWTARLDVPVRFAGRVGNDLLGRALVDDLRREGVAPSVVLDPQRPTAVLVLFSEGTQRHMMVPRGANHYLDEGDIPTSALRSAGWLHVTGYSFFWEATSRAAERALTIAREAGIPISFDPSSAGFIRRHGLTVPAGTQVLLPNREEALTMTGAATAEEAALQLAATVPLVAVKLGPEGALLCQEGRLTHVPAVPVESPVIDVTGAGDAWGAAFITLIRRGWEPQAAAGAANGLAARVVTRMGARATVPIPEEFTQQ